MRSQNHASFLAVIQLVRRRSRAALLVLLSVELLLAAAWRWPWTMAPIQTPFDYGTGHVAVVSENWRRHGALRQHFLPVMSIDPDLPEWPYRGPFSQEYTSVPPLAFILHYAATRALPGVEPVLLGKLLAQFLLASSTIVAALFLHRVFGAWPTLVGLSFLVWGVPSILWFANGYFAVTVGLAVQLVLVAWCAAVAASALDERDAGRAAGVSIHFGIGAMLAFLGAFADYLPLAANAVAVAGLAALAWYRRPAGSSRLLAAAAGIFAGSLAALAATALLYGEQMGFASYRDTITLRVAQRTGSAPFAEHLDVIRRQMLTAWPAELLVAVMAMLVVVLVWCAVSLARADGRSTQPRAGVVLLALAIGMVPSLYFHYRAVNYVRIHWWFAGTWQIGWAITICAFVWLVGRQTRAAAVFGLAMFALVVAANVRFTSPQLATDAGRAEAVQLYRSLGRDLPPDDLPLVVTDLTTDRSGLFEDFPYATAYLRRPVLLREPGGAVRLPAAIDLYDGKPLRLGGENASERLVRHGGDVYVAYDPDARQCHGADVPLAAWHQSVPINVCRASAAGLVQRPDAVLGPLSAVYPCGDPPVPPADLHVVSNRGGVVVVSWAESVTRRTSYVLEAGRTRGQADALTTNVGRSTTFTATQVQPGTYYVRVRGLNACGTGAASNELMVVAE
jgi:hypothetical protein